MYMSVHFKSTDTLINSIFYLLSLLNILSIYRGYSIKLIELVWLKLECNAIYTFRKSEKLQYFRVLFLGELFYMDTINNLLS